MPACDDIRAINWTESALYPDIGRIGGRNAVIGTTTKVCLAVGLLFLLELSAPDINIRLRIIGLIVCWPACSSLPLNSRSIISAIADETVREMKSLVEPPFFFCSVFRYRYDNSSGWSMMASDQPEGWCRAQHDPAQSETSHGGRFGWPLPGKHLAGFIGMRSFRRIRRVSVHFVPRNVFV
jgi:hypothetical protein